MWPRPFPLSRWVLWTILLFSGLSAILAAFLVLELHKAETARTAAAGFGPEMAKVIMALTSGETPLPHADALSWRLMSGNKFDEPTRRDWSTALFRLQPAHPDSFGPLLVRVSLQDSALDATQSPPGESLADQLSFLSLRIATLNTPGTIRAQVSITEWVEFTSPKFWIARPTTVQLTLVAVVSIMVLLGLMSLASAVIASRFSHLSDYAKSLLDPKQQTFLPENRGPSEAQDISKALNLVNRNQRESMLERTQFLAAISHDLRTPATRMQLRAELIDDDTIRVKLLSDLDEITTMITDAIDFLRDGVEQEKHEEILFITFVESICDDYIDVGKDVTFDAPAPMILKTTGTIFDPRPMVYEIKGERQITLLCQPNRLRRAINNLIDNALKYGNCARVNVVADSKSVIVQINDVGPGLSEDQMQLVFKPFYRTEASRNRSSGGAGLGLSLAKSVVEAHGGTIVLSNRAPCGLEVTMTLPRTNERAAIATRPALR